ncbi:hypothetical protein HELRODRAFT_190660 [Helobdella robusta]|uniref:Uncharacterized protein n=1 Tax=Helobdella robusta TaxID=6412 RepID=T1FS66_HELRO|nr:hypothetical protein HELRODRAFT_190660 [Helobdella robusta]ESO08918.1 hypothetical protein HELRODRAFT_190660 [Helobdella robusta]
MIQTIKLELLKYAENTSIKGISKFVKSNNVFIKGLWSLFFIVSLIYMTFLMCKVFQNYYSYPVNTMRGELMDGALKFPDITLCNLDIFAEGESPYMTKKKHSEILQSLKPKIERKIKKSFQNHLVGEKEIGYEYFESLSQHEVDERQNADSYLDKIIENSFKILNSIPGYIMSLKKDRDKSVDCPNFIVDCQFFDMDWFPIDAKCSVKNFTREWNSQYYTCYSLQMNEMKIPNGSTVRGLSLLLNVGPPYPGELEYDFSMTRSQARGVQVNVHSPGTPPNFRWGFSLPPGTESIVEIIQTERIREDYPYTNSGCSKAEKMSQAPEYNYSRDLCMDFCKQQHIKENCGCYTHLLNVPSNDTKLCGYNVSDTGDNMLANFFCLIKFLNLDQSQKCRNTCLVPCKESVYDTLLATATWPQASVRRSIFKKYIEGNCTGYKDVVSRYASYYENYNASSSVSAPKLTEIEESFLEIKLGMKQGFPFSEKDSQAYTTDAMVGTVGGMLSLWLGITVASAVEVVELICLLLNRLWDVKKPTCLRGKYSVENMKNASETHPNEYGNFSNDAIRCIDCKAVIKRSDENGRNEFNKY